MESWTFLWGCNTNTPMNCHVQLCGPLSTHSLHRYSCLLVCSALCHHMSQGFHIMGLLCHITGSATLQVFVLHHRVCHAMGLLHHITGSVMPQVCCIISQGLSCSMFVASHHRVCHATGLLCHITGCVMPQVCCVTSQGLSSHRFVVLHHRVC